jgi:hypothetical protein
MAKAESDTQLEQAAVQHRISAKTTREETAVALTGAKIAERNPNQLANFFQSVQAYLQSEDYNHRERLSLSMCRSYAGDPEKEKLFISAVRRCFRSMNSKDSDPQTITKLADYVYRRLDVFDENLKPEVFQYKNKNQLEDPGGHKTKQPLIKTLAKLYVYLHDLDLDCNPEKIVFNQRERGCGLYNFWRLCDLPQGALLFAMPIGHLKTDTSLYMMQTSFEILISARLKGNGQRFEYDFLSDADNSHLFSEHLEKYVKQAQNDLYGIRRQLNSCFVDGLLANEAGQADQAPEEAVVELWQRLMVTKTYEYSQMEPAGWDKMLDSA